MFCFVTLMLDTKLLKCAANRHASSFLYRYYIIIIRRPRHVSYQNHSSNCRVKKFVMVKISLSRPPSRRPVCARLPSVSAPVAFRYAWKYRKRGGSRPAAAADAAPNRAESKLFNLKRMTSTFMFKYRKERARLLPAITHNLFPM